ncbi:MAG: YfiR family protein [Desulfobulbaceae bacterium]|nr:YfiR family protein [Desulfobulbaceae bacterium]
MISPRIYKILTLLVALLWIATPTHAQLQESKEQEIKAAFLVQFIKYVKWPSHCFAGADNPIVIGIIGPDPFGSTIDKISRSVSTKGRSVEVRRLRSLSGVNQCHILYISSEEPERIEEIITLLSNKPLILVSDRSDFLTLGGTIQFIKVDSKMRFAINTTNLKRKGLKISSKLLNVAHKVE